MLHVSGDNLEIGSLTGASRGSLFIRSFRVVDGDAFTDETLILEGHQPERFRLLRTIEDECSAILTLDDDRLACLGAFGNLYFYGAGTWRDCKVEIEPFYFLNGLWEFHGKLFAAGTHGRILRWENEQWLSIATSREEADIMDMVLAADGQIYAVGSNGFLARLVGDRAEPLVVPTNADLNAIAIDYHGRMLIGGTNGILLHGLPDRWDILDTENHINDFYSVRFWNGRCFVSAESEILTVNDDGVKVHSKLESFGFNIANGALWNLGISRIYRLYVDTWQEITVAVDISTGPGGAPSRKI